MKIKNVIGHIKTVLTHKWYVFVYCCKLGIPLQGILHDMSKFSPIEFFESVKYYTGTRSPIDNCKMANNGYSAAWEHHKSINKHHYEYWTDKGKNIHGDTIPMMMPRKYMLELVADYIAAGITYTKARSETFTYKAEYDYVHTKMTDNIHINYVTKMTILHIFNMLMQYEREQPTSIKSIWKFITNDDPHIKNYIKR